MQGSSRLSCGSLIIMTLEAWKPHLAEATFLQEILADLPMSTAEIPPVVEKVTHNSLESADQKPLNFRLILPEIQVNLPIISTLSPKKPGASELGDTPHLLHLILPHLLQLID